MARRGQWRQEEREGEGEGDVKQVASREQWKEEERGRERGRRETGSK